MRVAELSNHPSDMLGDLTRQRATAGKRALAAYSDELIQYRARIEAARVQRDRARRQHHWLAWVRLSVRTWRQKRQLPPPPEAAGPGRPDAEERIRAGIAGEELVASELGRALDDEWIMLRGYHNRRGEIDQLLLGPRGLFAIEVKNVNATVQVDGDRWRADKYDNYGHLVEQRPMADRRGRSPSEQLNEPAAELERFLRDRGQPVTIERVVVLAHHRSELGRYQNLTVLIGTSPLFVLKLIRQSRAELDDAQRGELERLIVHDHEHAARSRPPGRPPGRRPPGRGSPGRRPQARRR